MLKRKRGANRGLWLAPGGRVEADESPYEAARREFHEETGLTAEKLIFRGTVTLITQRAFAPAPQTPVPVAPPAEPQPSPASPRTSLIFLYACTAFSGELLEATPEGRLKWQHLHRVFDLPMPPANQRWLHPAININLPLYNARIATDLERNIIEYHEF